MLSTIVVLGEKLSKVYRMLLTNVDNMMKNTVADRNINKRTIAQVLEMCVV